MTDIFIEEQQIPGSERQGYIFNAFDSLEVEDSITILSKYDPEALLTQLNENQVFQFAPEYLVNGPEEWKVKITKRLKDTWIPLH